MQSRLLAGIAFSLASTFASAAHLALTQTASQTPTPGSVTCNTAGVHTANSYWRAIDLAPQNLPGPIVVNNVQFGVERADANGVGTTQPVTVNVYTSAGPFPASPLTLRASQLVNLPDQNLSLVTVPLTVPTVPLPANSIVVLELAIPDGRAPANNRFFIGSNASAQSGPSYLSAPDCGIAAPTDLAALGFPNMHIILNGNGVPRTISENIACATDALNALVPPTIVGPAQKSLLLQLLGVAAQNQAAPYRSLGLAAVNSVIARVDGCTLRTTPDTLASHGGTGLDFVTTCPAQNTMYSCLKDAQTQLMAPPPP